MAENSPHIDRWHYMDYADGSNRARYIEWKYFNFSNENISGYFLYYVLDPEHKTKVGGGRLIFRLFKDGKSYGYLKKIPVERISFDDVSASVNMDGSTIKEVDSYHYDTNGKIDDLEWNLSYKQEAPTIESFSDINPGMMGFEKVSWLIKMPKAEVKGAIKIGDEVIDINALGYSDTNWGEIVPFFTKYEWGQINTKDSSLVFGFLYNFGKIKNSYFYYIGDGQKVFLEKGKCVSKQLKWKKDPQSGIKMPIETEIRLTEGEYEVLIHCNLVDHDTLALKILPLIPKPVVSEQIVDYVIQIKKGGNLLKEIKGRGFKEWSTKTIRKVPILF